MRSANLKKTQLARTLRRNSTNAEARLWNRLRGRSIGGCKFVRQEPIGRYVVDFVCREQRLIVEVDGGQHAENQKDQNRDQWLRDHNFRILRFWNNEVLANTDGVLEQALHTGTPPHPARNSASKTRVNALVALRPLPASRER